MTVAPYGSWPSPITADALVGQVVPLSNATVDGHGSVWWCEGRPTEAGRVVVVKDGVDVLPAGRSARSRVHEYGGLSYAVLAGELWFANFADQRLYRGDTPVTPDDGSRYADGQSTVWVREREDVNDLVDVATGEVVAQGRDFYAAPRPSPDGSRLAYLCWDHPNMPWDGTELWVDGDKVAGGPDESISQPRWSPDGRLHWVSDRSGWWNLFREGDPEPLAAMEAEFSGPDWVFGQSTYTFLPDGRLVATWTEDGLARLGLVGDGAVHPIDTPFTVISSVHALGDHEVVAIAASGRAPAAVVAIDVRLDTGAGPGAGAHRVIRSSTAAETPDGAVSEARPISFAGAHAFFYPPRLAGYEGPPGERPPLVVRSHGGPTSAASPALNLEIQFWTSRGFAVVDVNYGGSTGYGREYRRRLDGQWGIVDLDDCVNAARHLAAQGEVDPDRMVVRGGSAGGYTTLCALTFRDTFAAGASYYGVSDLATLATDTHKFESRYLDRLIGRYPEDEAVYRARSPIHHADCITAPLILLQGLEDMVVPPSQAEVLVDALRRNGTPFAYLTFEGEQHGFRQADAIKRAIEAELWFYGQVLGFTPADAIEPVPMENWR